MKILFIVKKIVSYQIYGTVGLQNSAQYVSNALNKLGYTSKVAVVDDSNGIDKAVYEYKPDLCILEAVFASPSKIKEVLNLHPFIDFIVRLHSTASFISLEGNVLRWLVEYKELNLPNLFISCNHKEFNNELSKVLGIHSIYLPNIYYPLDKLNIPKVNKDYSDFIDISVLGAIRPFKNHLQQAIAAIIYANKIGKYLRFYVNAGRTEMDGNQVLKSLGGLFSQKGMYHELIELDWLTREQLLETLSFIDVALQVSYVESYNLTIADSIKAGVVSVGSPAISWLPEDFQGDPNSAEDIVETMEYCLKDPVETISRQKGALHKSNYHAIEVWEKFLEDYE